MTVKSLQELVKSRFEGMFVDKKFGQMITRETETITYDDNGYMTSRTTATDQIKAVIITQVDADKQWLDVGKLEVGDAIGYFEVGDNIQEEQHITTADYKYKITRIMNKADMLKGTACFVVCYLQMRGRAA
jgi:hypothetical protein